MAICKIGACNRFTWSVAWSDYRFECGLGRRPKDPPWPPRLLLAVRYACGEIHNAYEFPGYRMYAVRALARAAAYRLRGDFVSARAWLKHARRWRKSGVQCARCGTRVTRPIWSDLFGAWYCASNCLRADMADACAGMQEAGA